MRGVGFTVGWTLVGLLCTGCAGRARVELAAADALDALSAELLVALAEYEQDLASADAAREASATAAYLQRVQRDADDPDKLTEHTAQLLAALERLRADRRVAWERYDASRDNVAVAREVAAELRRLAIAGLSLQTDAQRYVEALIDAQKQANTPPMNR